MPVPPTSAYYQALGPLNERIDVLNPDPDDLIELGEISAIRNQGITSRFGERPIVISPGPKKVRDVQVGEFGFDRIRLAAQHYAETYSGDFEFMIAMKAEMREHNRLTNKQVAGVLNTMIAEARRNRRYRFGSAKAKARIEERRNDPGTVAERRESVKKSRFGKRRTQEDQSE